MFEYNLNGRRCLELLTTSGVLLQLLVRVQEISSGLSFIWAFRYIYTWVQGKRVGAEVGGLVGDRLGCLVLEDSVGITYNS